MLNVDLINQWMIKEAYNGAELAEKLEVHLRTITSLRRNQKNHGRKVVQKLANLMGLDVMDLYL
jgi:plasmid maintenance system antidote protein VapI